MRLQRGLETEARRQREEARYAGPRVRALGCGARATCAGRVDSPSTRLQDVEGS